MFGLLGFLFNQDFGTFSDRKWAKKLNDYQFLNTFVNYLNIALDMFEWENLPDTCDARFLELALINKGMAGFFQDPDMGVLSLPCTGVNNLNVYGYYDRLVGYGLNGYNKEMKAYIPHADNVGAKAFPIWDNEMRYPFLLYIAQMSERITSAMRSIDVASKKLKNPYIVSCEQSQASSIRQIFKSVDDNEQLIVVTKSLNPDSFQILPTNQDHDNLEVLWNHYRNLDNEIRTTLGITNNPAPNKKERLLTNEIDSNNEITMIQADMRLKCRLEFCEQYNDFNGTNISVKLKNNVDESEVDDSELEESELSETLNSFKEST